MRIEAVEVRRLSLPMIDELRAGHGTVSNRELIVVHVLGSNGEGWGECSALSEPTYTAEYVDGAHHVLVNHLIPRALDGPLDPEAGLDPVGMIAALEPVRGHSMAKAALEVAVLDMALRQDGRSLSEHLGGTAERVQSGIVLGMTESLDAVVTAAVAAAEAGYHRLKLKIAPGWDVEPVRAVRELLPNIVLQVDANGAYGASDVAALAALDDFGLACIEQPVAAGDLLGSALVAASIATPVCLDESASSYDEVATALDLRAGSVICLKPGRVGGIEESRRIHDLCLDAGVPVMVGGMVSGGIGRAVELAVASLPGCTLPGDIGASGRWFSADVTAPTFLDDEGMVTVPDGPGLGVAVSAEAVDDLTVTVDVVRPGRMRR